MNHAVNYLLSSPLLYTCVKRALVPMPSFHDFTSYKILSPLSTFFLFFFFLFSHLQDHSRQNGQGHGWGHGLSRLRLPRSGDHGAPRQGQQAKAGQDVLAAFDRCPGG